MYKMETTPEALFHEVVVKQELRDQEEIDMILQACDKSLKLGRLKIDFPTVKKSTTISKACDHLRSLGFDVSWNMMHSTYNLTFIVEREKIVTTRHSNPALRKQELPYVFASDRQADVAPYFQPNDPPNRFIPDTGRMYPGVCGMERQG